MNKQTFVGVFNPEWQLVAAVTNGSGGLVVIDVLPHDYGQVITGVLERLKTERPKLNLPVKDEAGCVVDMLRVSPDDGRYMDGVVNELKQPGLQAYALDYGLLDILKKVNASTTGLRAQVVPEVLSLDVEHATIALEAII